MVAACFGVGFIVRKNAEIAERLAFPQHSEKRIVGFSLAAQVAAEHGKDKILDFCISHGADPRLTSVEDDQSLLDILTRNKDFERLTNFLPQLNRASDLRFLSDMLESPSLTTNFHFRTRVQETVARLQKNKPTSS